MESFSRLGLPVTRDVAAIKKAYQEKLPECHPEENPQGFMELHQAYKNALAYAQGQQVQGKPFDFSTEGFQDPPREENDYDSLFSDLEQERGVDISHHKKRFVWHIRWMHLHWLPISRKRWGTLLGSEAFFQCRRDPECMERLLELAVIKIHTYDVFLYLVNRLWELVEWQSGEGLEALAAKTRRCIRELGEQYSHYRKADMNRRENRLLCLLIWYYQALPFYFKLWVSIFLFPLMVFGSDTAMVWLLLCFYVLEAGIGIGKSRRSLGPFHIKHKWKNGIATPKTQRDGLAVVLGIYAVLIHMACCISLAAG